MTEKNTDQLQQELMSSNDLDRFLSENDDSFRDTPLQLTLQRLFNATGLSKAALAKQSGISEVYLLSLPQPAAVRMLWAGRVGGGHPGPAAAGAARAAVHPRPAGRHHFIRSEPRHGPVSGQRQAIY